MILRTENFAKNRSNYYLKAKRMKYSQVVIDKHTDLKSVKVKRREIVTSMIVTMI